MSCRFGPYEVLEPLAVGGMATLDRVQAASRDAAGQPFVLKRLLPERKTDASWRKMFRHEIELTAALNHENCVVFHEGGEFDGELYLVLGEVRGPHLGQLIGAGLRRGHPVPGSICIEVLRQVALGLAHLHQWRGGGTGGDWRAVHRDICPQNIMIDGDGNVRIIDFGLAYSQNAPSELAANTVRGRPGYMSPEQCSGDSVDPRSDVFAWGVVAHEILCQKRLFKSDTPDGLLALNAAAEVATVRSFNPAVPATVADLVDAALVKNRDERVPDMQRIAERLRAWQQTQEAFAAPVSLREWMETHWLARSQKIGEDMLSSSQPGES